MLSPAAVEARSLSLITKSGVVYRDVDLLVPTGSLAVITGPARSGKTALLLTLAGRMAPSGGELRVAGLEGRRRAAIRRVVGLGEFRGVNDLDETLSVRDLASTELAMYGQRRNAACTETVVNKVGLRLEPGAEVSTLDAADRLLLGAALGMVGEPQILVLDEVDGNTTPEERERVLSSLRRLTGAGLTVIAGAVDPALAAAADVAFSLDGDALVTSSPSSSEVTHELP